MNKKNILSLTSAMLLIISCSGSGRIKDIVDFTSKLSAEISGYQITLPAPAPTRNWAEGAGWINSQPHNFSAACSDKFTKHKVSKGRMIAAPVMADGKIFTLSEEGILSAIDVAYREGSLKNNSSKSVSYDTLWSADLKRQSTSTNFESGAMSFHNGILFLTYSTRDVIAFDASAGKELWRRRLPDVVKTQPVIYQNMAVIQTLNNQTYAMDTNNGKIIWQHDGLAETLAAKRNIAPIIHEGKVIVGYSSGQLVALNLVNGQELWQLNLSREGDILPSYVSVALESQPVIEGGSLYIASGNGYLLKVNMENGAVFWQNRVQDIQSMNSAGNALFVTTNAKEVAALSTDTGKVIWVTDLDPQEVGKKPKSRKPMQILTPTVVNNELIIISSDGKLRHLSAQTGEITKITDIEKGAQFITVSDKFNIFTNSNVLSSE